MSLGLCSRRLAPSIAKYSDRLRNEFVRSWAYATKAEEYDLIAEEKGLARIDGYAVNGFTVSNEDVEGAVLCIGNLCTKWNVQRREDITIDSVSLLDLIHPAPDLLIIGCGRSSMRLPEAFTRGLSAKGISVEAIDTPNAAATFNILNQEGRKVAGALLPLGSQ
ncbi:probable NADH dehydrogenase [ubiquinone] 1 alpha subcomplex assembly factor [Coccomyxa sp. Obi]|nr:probable NADH dehydrogenase [ubiquinone] 1 alpha subcomplex assembly factor [Coccomyxa sp. Obi]